jgi:hypothetical protein
MASAAETKGAALGPVFYMVIAKRLLWVTSRTTGSFPATLIIAPFASCFIVLDFVLLSRTIEVRGVVNA